jgi:hypothetical protein
MREVLAGVLAAVLVVGVEAGLQARPGAGSTVAAQTRGGASAPCDRACLEGFVDRFLDAFVQHDPRRLPLAANARFTENGQRLALGDGSWRTMVGRGAYRLFVTDPPAGQAAFIGTLREENASNAQGAPVLIALRLKVASRQISEIEVFIVRNERAAQNVEALGRPHPLFLGHAAERRQGRLSLHR